MIIDNKRPLENNMTISTVWEYLKKYVSNQDLNIVTGYFTISALCLLKEFEKEPKNFRLILGEIAGVPELKEHIINLLSGNISIENAFQLNSFAKKAIEFLQQKNVKVKRIDKNFCHAKTYIYEDKKDGHACFHITGSSNLSEAGLGLCPSSNVELNIAEHCSDRENFKGLLNWFNEIWDKEAHDKIEVIEDGVKTVKTVKQYFVDCINNLYKQYQPKDIYFKILYELFNHDIEASVHDSNNRQLTRLEETVIYNTLFDYQKKGVKSLINMLTKYNGAILADAVGLGKTFTALAVMKYFQSKGYVTLVLCPKKLEENWQQYRFKRGSRFEADQFDYEVRFHTDLQDDRLQNNYDTAKLDWLKRQARLFIVIDESHNLRNDKSGRYQYLLKHLLSEDNQNEIKVLELSATPINTNINDVRNQFKLFVRGRDDGFKGSDFEVNSLTDLFKTAQKHLTDWNGKPERTIRDLVDSLPEKFFNLTDKLVVARTRKMIEKSESKALGFPKKNRPENIYKGIDRIGNLTTFEEIYEALLAPMLCAYQPNAYIIPQDSQGGFGDQRNREFFLVYMMLSMFLKRLESSWVACKLTVEKVLAYHEKTLSQVERYINNHEDSNIDDDGVPNDDNDEDFTLGKKNPVSLSEIKDIELFRNDLKKDILLLKEFISNLQLFQDEFNAGNIQDEKLEILKAKLSAKVKQSNKKVLIFTSYSDTANYLYQQLDKVFPGKVARVDGSGALYKGNFESKFQYTLMRFAPYSKMYKEFDWSDMYHRYYILDDQHFDREKNKWNVSFEEWKHIIAQSNDDFAKTCKKLLHEPVQILIATDCLSEGQNLQDAQTVINYDVHWNPVRLIQRVGRIDRIGSPNPFIDCYNFWPTSSFEGYLNLANRINERMATMALIGVETLNISEELTRQLEDNPIIDKNDAKLLENLQNSIEDIEDGNRAFGLEDLSYENFRQDLLEVLKGKTEELKNIPCGVFSGFKTEEPIFEGLSDGIIALVGTPHKPVEATEHKYTDLWLILRPINSLRKEDIRIYNRQEILSLLRSNINKRRHVPALIDHGDPKTLDELKSIMRNWIKEEFPHAQKDLIKMVLDGKNLTAEDNLDDKFRGDNMDLIAWEYITQ